MNKINSIPPKGLENVGATCYMNAVLQCFYHVKPLTSELITYNSTYNLNQNMLKQYPMTIAYLDVVAGPEWLEKQYGHAADEVAQCALHCQGYGDAGRCEDGHKTGQRDSHYICRGQDHDNVKNELDQVLKKTLQRWFNLDKPITPPEECHDPMNEKKADDEDNDSSQQFHALSLNDLNDSIHDNAPLNHYSIFLVDGIGSRKVT